MGLLGATFEKGQRLSFSRAKRTAIISPAVMLMKTKNARSQDKTY
jgi:hypothetical protein